MRDVHSGDTCTADSERAAPHTEGALLKRVYPRLGLMGLAGKGDNGNGIMGARSAIPSAGQHCPLSRLVPPASSVRVLERRES